MAARKRKTTTPTRRRRRTTRRKKKETWKPALAALAGGVGTAGLGYLMIRGGVSPLTTAVGLTAAGGVAALTTDGGVRSAALGAAGMGTGQLALALITAQATKGEKATTAKATVVNKKRRSDAYADDIESAFDRARDQLAMEEAAAAFDDQDFEGDAA